MAGQLTNTSTSQLEERLAAVLLSPECCTDRDDRAETGHPTKVMTDEQLLQVLRDKVATIDSMYDRTGSTPVAKYIVSTYRNGLPLYKAQPHIQKHTITAIRVFFDQLHRLSPGRQTQLVTRLAEAFQACQAEQGRVIDTLYGEVTGRDKSLRDQLLVLVDEQKQNTLDQLANALNPHAWKASDAYPSKQLPHIQNGYRILIGARLGLRGVAAAGTDISAKDTVSTGNVDELVRKFRERFSVADLASTITSDINQQSDTAERRIMLEALMKWAGKQGESHGAFGTFNKHDLFYDEDQPERYNNTKPREENMYQPFVYDNLVMQMLARIFLPEGR